MRASRLLCLLAAHASASVTSSAHGPPTGRDWNLSSASDLINSACTPQEAFTALSFATARLVRSNLGGQGGRCVNMTYDVNESYTWDLMCDEEQSPSTPHEILMRGLGTTPDNNRIDLRITNESDEAIELFSPTGLPDPPSTPPSPPPLPTASEWVERQLTKSESLEEMKFDVQAARERARSLRV